MSDLTIIVTVTPINDTQATFSYAASETSINGWSLDPDGGIQPPSGSGSGTIEFQLQPSGASFAGFEVSTTPHPPEGWASWARLDDFHLRPSSPWPPDKETASEPLIFALDYGAPQPSPESCIYYKLTAEVNGKRYGNDPKIYNDPVT